MSTVTFLHDPACDPSLHAAVGRMHDPAAGAVVLAVKPGIERTAGVFTALLERLGKVNQEYEHTRAANDAEGYALAWLAVENVRRLVVLDATLCGKWIKPLCLAAVACGIEVVLFTDAEVSDHFRVAISGLAGNMPRPVHEWLDEQPSSVVEAAESPPAEGVCGFGSVPRTQFLTFRADMRRALAASEFASADAVYRGAFHAAAKVDLRDESKAGSLLHRLMIATVHRQAQTVIIRAAQAAAFHQGVHLTVDVDRALDAVGPAARAANLDDRDWRRVSGWVRPFFPAVVALTAAGVAVEELQEVSGREVSIDATTVTHEAHRLDVPVDGQASLRAQHLVRGWFGHDADAPFLSDRAGVDARSANDALNLMTRTHGIPLRRRAVGTEQSVNWWKAARGVRVSPLEEPH